MPTDRKGHQEDNKHPAGRALMDETANRTNLQAANDARAKIRREGNSSVKSPIEKAGANPNSLRLAVNAMCFQCEGCDADPCVQWRIGNCNIPDCALYAVRPYRYMRGRPVPASLRAAGWPDDEYAYGDTTPTKPGG